MDIKQLAPNALYAARTNSIRLLDEPADASRKILAHLQLQTGSAWCIDVVQLSGSDTAEVQIQRAKKALARDLRVPSARSVPFFRGKDGQRYYFLRPRKGAERPQSHADLEGIEALVVIRLYLLKALLEATQFGANSTAVESVGPRIFVGVRSLQRSDSAVIIDALELILTLHHGALVVNLSSRRFGRFGPESASVFSGKWKIESATMQRPILSVIDPASLTRLDGRRSNLKDIDFSEDGLRLSKVYFYNLLVEFFGGQLEQAGVAHAQDVFRPNFVVDRAFLPLARLANDTLDLMVINATGQTLPEDAIVSIGKALQLPHRKANIRFRSIAFHLNGRSVSSENNDALRKLKPEMAYLFLNAMSPIGGTSVRFKDEWLNNPFDAYDDLQTGMAQPADVDPYTFTKFAHLYSNSTGFAPLQGIDLVLENGQTRIDEKVSEALRRCAVELTLKSQFARRRFPVSFGTPEGRYLLAHTTNRRIQRDHRNILVAAITEISISGGELEIISFARHVDIGLKAKNELIARHGFLGSEIHDDRFFLVCQRTKECLKRFSGSFIPKVLLNDKYVTIESALTAMAEGGAISEKGVFSRGRKWSLFPFYTPPDRVGTVLRNWRSALFAEDRQAYLRYFSPSSMPLRAKPGFSNLHDLMVFRGDMPISSGLPAHHLIAVYLTCLTNGVARINENSKTSLLEKIARMAGLDT